MVWLQIMDDFAEELMNLSKKRFHNFFFPYLHRQHVGKEISMFTGRMRSNFNVVRMRKRAKSYLEKFNEFKTDLGGVEYIKGAFLGLASFNTFLAVLIGLGLLHVCGSRPGRGRSCRCALISALLLTFSLLLKEFFLQSFDEITFTFVCIDSRGTGACFLMTAVSLFLLLGWILVIIFISLFLAGSQVKTEVCFLFSLFISLPLGINFTQSNLFIFSHVQVCHPVMDPLSYPNSSLEMFVKDMSIFDDEVTWKVKEDLCRHADDYVEIVCFPDCRVVSISCCFLIIQVNELSFSDILSKCQRNNTIYSILKATQLFDDDFHQFESQITLDKVS